LPSQKTERKWDVVMADRRKEAVEKAAAALNVIG
jgi:hypothetical protein